MRIYCFGINLIFTSVITFAGRRCSKVCQETSSEDRGNAHAYGRIRFAVPAAYWAWVDALHMISQRFPEVANDIVTQLAGELVGCLAELQGAANDLDWCGFVKRSSWEALKAGASTCTRGDGTWRVA